MTERRIQDALWIDRGRQHMLVCPNYTPAEWWECDMWMVTKASYAVEFEIKLSLEDFRADRTKTKNFYPNRQNRELPFEQRWQEDKKTKHEMLAARDPRAPSRFYFVTPEGSGVTLEMIPEWAGLIVAEPVHYPGMKYKGVRLAQQKEAPKLHSQKVADKTLEHCRSVFYYRYWNIRSRLRDEKILTDPAEGAESPQITGDSPDVSRALDT